MAHINQFTAAAVAARAETTLALANLNFEINLFTKRVNPPAEYAGIGQHLSPLRLQEALEGSQHATARKLGFLFRSVLPDTPNLIRAYGSRASQIVSAVQEKSSSRNASSYGPFSGVVGTDATSLWAAATSGHAAIQCHLLGCMLARMWDAPEATSLWEEIVSCRKSQVAAMLDERGEIETDLMLSASQKFPRSDLANLDASCRSWLRVADNERLTQQTQLRLIINNLDEPVNSKPDAYQSVMEAWKAAMTEVEKLLEGIPRSVQNGSVLLGLMAWHLYPDLNCLSATPPLVRFKDALLQGRGVLTIGIQPSPGTAARAVFWSLPLAHLRYYGLPVTKITSTRTSERDRITPDELLFVWLMSYIRDWDNNVDVPTQEVLDFISQLCLNLHKMTQIPRSWFSILSQTASQWVNKLGSTRATSLRILGRNLSRVPGSPFRHLLTVQAYLDAGLYVEDKIRLLRTITTSLRAQEVSETDYQYLIIYSMDSGVGRQGGFEVATACAEFEFKDGSVEKGTGATRAFRRWVSVENHPGPTANMVAKLEARLREIESRGEKADAYSTYPFFSRAQSSAKTSQFVHRTSHSSSINIPASSHRKEAGNTRQSLKDHEYSVAMRLSKSLTYGYDVLYGDVMGTALLQRRSTRVRRSVSTVVHQETVTSKHGTEVPYYELSPKQTVRLFTADKVDFRKLLKHLKLDTGTESAVLGITYISQLYGSLREATVDVRAATVNLKDAYWVKSALSVSWMARKKQEREPSGDVSQKLPYLLDPKHTGLATKFSCIAMMETGYANLLPESLWSVFAICSADSLYVASVLLRDPGQAEENGSGIVRMTGNIGRAGMAFMTPPPSPNIRNYDLDDWYQYQYRGFDGVSDDSFHGTSLQLSFTEWSQPLNMGTTGGKDVEAYFLETLLSTYEDRTWIADLDVLTAMRNERLIKKFQSLATCPHFKAASLNPARSPPSCWTGPKHLVSVSNFAEMIVTPSDNGVITATGNWEARLAATVICISKGYTVILKPDRCCWECFFKAEAEGESASAFIARQRRVVMLI